MMFDVLAVEVTAALEAGATVPCVAAPDGFLSEDYPTRQASALRCTSCPLARVCGETALAERVGFGVWGGADCTPRHGCRRGLDLLAERLAPTPDLRKAA